MKPLLSIAIGITWLVLMPTSQTIPELLWGKWRISRELPTKTISCWGEAEAKTLVGTEIEYAPVAYRWKNVVTNHPIAESKIVSAEQFHDGHSGQGSQVTFRQLGIREK